MSAIKGKSCRLLAALAILAAATELRAQQGCPSGLVFSPPPADDIFSPQQEVWLGEAEAAQIEPRFRLSRDPAVTGYLQQIGDRLLAPFPPLGFKIQYALVDLSAANAFTLPGGRVYVSRKIVELARNEDELAGVLAHELGHAVTRQGAVDATLRFKRVLGVASLGDRKDIFNQYQQLLDRERGRLRAGHAEGLEEKADRAALVALAGAGYSLEGLPDLFDRVAGTQGKTGSWFSDLLGSTPPDSRRLRVMFKNVAALPPECVHANPPQDQAGFKKWQAEVLTYDGWAHQEVLPGLLSKVALQPLRSQLVRVQFSPDGRYLLAQDPAEVFVLSRDPLAIVLDIDAPEAGPAQFSPDSKWVVFVGRSLRVETWDIAGRLRLSLRDVGIPGGCLESRLAPDGRYLGCVTTKLDLILEDVGAGTEVFRQKARAPVFGISAFSQALYRLWLELGVDIVPMQFSPDGRYFVAYGDETWAIALSSGERVRLGGALKTRLAGGFVFLAPDRALLFAPRAAKSRVVEFPSGRVLEEVPLAGAGWQPVTRGEYVLRRPSGRYAVAAFDPRTGRSVLQAKTPALDFYGQLFAGETENGELGIFDLSGNQPATGKALPAARLAGLQAFAVSPDMSRLAVSVANRSTVWDLKTGKQMGLEASFRGAYFASDGGLYADFPAQGENPRAIRRLDLSGQETRTVFQIDAPHAQQHGRYLVVTETDPRLGFAQFSRDVTRRVRDVVTGAELWHEHFEDAPSLATEPSAGTMVLYWPANSRGAADELKQRAEEGQPLLAVEREPGDRFLEVVDAATGRRLSALVIAAKDGPAVIDDVFAAGDWLVVSDGAENRVLLYSLKSGKEQGRFFGRDPVLSEDGRLVALRNELDHLYLYDAATSEERDEFVFSSPILLYRFSTDGKRLLAITSDQTAYTLDVAAWPIDGLSGD